VRKILVGVVAVVVGLGLVLPGGAMAADKKEADLKVQEATLAVKKFLSVPDVKAARWLLKRSLAVAIFPGMVKAGFVIGGRFGRGVIVKRLDDGTFSGPAFFTIGGANVGFQIGAESTDLFMFIIHQKGLNGILHNKLKFGVDASVAAGPVGRQAEASLSAASLKADIYSYSQSKGLYAGAVLEGAGIEFDKDMTRAYYGRPVSVKQIFDGKVKVPPSGRELARVLVELAK